LTGLALPGKTRSRPTGSTPPLKALAGLHPLPNLDGDRQNFYHSTTASTTRQHQLPPDAFVRYDPAAAWQQVPGLRRHGGGRGAAGGRGSVNLSLGVQLHALEERSDDGLPHNRGARPGGNAWDIPASVNFSRWGLMNAVRSSSTGAVPSRRTGTRMRRTSRATQGIPRLRGMVRLGPPQPSRSRASTSLRDTAPSSRVEQTLTFGDTVDQVEGTSHAQRGLRMSDSWSTDSRVNTNPARHIRVPRPLHRGTGGAFSRPELRRGRLPARPDAAGQVQYGQGNNVSARPAWTSSSRMTGA